jgi:outer membrane protein assembly factor BamE
MQNKLTPLLIALCLLQACSFPGVFKINVQQGNIITQEMLDTLKPGMNKDQVHFVLGTPAVRNVFNAKRENYLYTYQPAGGEIQRQLIIVHYDDNGLYTSHEGELLEDNPVY